MQNNYDILERTDANELRARLGGEVFENIYFNLSTVYKLSDETYLVMPGNPFAKCLATKDKGQLEKWISNNYYPTNEKINAFYFENREQFDDLPKFQTVLIDDLLKYVIKHKKELPKPLDLDEIHQLLKQKKAFNKYKLNFIALVGSSIIDTHPEDGLCWAKGINKQLLNPVITLVLSKTKDNEEKYFDLQELIDGKWGYRGLQYIEHRYGGTWKRPNEITSLQKLN